MKRVIAVVPVACLLVGLTVSAQPPARGGSGGGPMQGQKIGVATSLQRGYAGFKTNFTQAAEKMPEADYTFKPGSTPEARTYTQVIEGGPCRPAFFRFILPTMSAFENIGEFEHVVLLAVLRLGDEAYAVPIRDEIARCTARDVSRGSIYITLDRLETKGFLKSRLGDPTPERGGRPKRYYELRPRAIEALRESRLVALWRGIEAKLA